MSATPNKTLPLIGHAEVAAFAETNVNLPSEFVAEYRARVNSLRDALEAKIAADPAYAVVRAVNAGSLAKGTALRTTSDFDLAVYLRPDRIPLDRRQLSGWLVERLKEARPQLNDSQFRPLDHCVSIEYKDGRTVDVVPILDAGDGTGDGDLIRKDTGERIRTNIRKHVEFVRRRKARLPIHYRQVIRLVKWWSEQRKHDDQSFRFKSYLAELVCAHLFDAGVDFANYPDTLAQIFAYIKKSGLLEPIIFQDYYKRSEAPSSVHGRMTVVDAVNPNNNIVSDYSETNRLAIVAAASTALDAIVYAEYTPHRSEAVAAWREVLGGQFRG